MAEMQAATQGERQGKGGVEWLAQLWKTKPCKFYALGLCTKGPQCRFAHSSTELRPLPDLRNTRMCPKLMREGRCGNWACTFAHRPDHLLTSLGKLSGAVGTEAPTPAKTKAIKAKADTGARARQQPPRRARAAVEREQQQQPPLLAAGGGAGAQVEAPSMAKAAQNAEAWRENHYGLPVMGEQMDQQPPLLPAGGAGAQIEAPSMAKAAQNDEAWRENHYGLPVMGEQMDQQPPFLPAGGPIPPPPAPTRMPQFQLPRERFEMSGRVAMQPQGPSGAMISTPPFSPSFKAEQPQHPQNHAYLNVAAVQQGPDLAACSLPDRAKQGCSSWDRFSSSQSTSADGLGDTPCTSFNEWESQDGTDILTWDSCLREGSHRSAWGGESAEKDGADIFPLEDCRRLAWSKAEEDGADIFPLDSGLGEDCRRLAWSKAPDEDAANFFPLDSGLREDCRRLAWNNASPDEDAASIFPLDDNASPDEDSVNIFPFNNGLREDCRKVAWSNAMPDEDGMDIRTWDYGLREACQKLAWNKGVIAQENPSTMRVRNTFIEVVSTEPATTLKRPKSVPSRMCLASAGKGGCKGN